MKTYTVKELRIYLCLDNCVKIYMNVLYINVQSIMFIDIQKKNNLVINLWCISYFSYLLGNIKSINITTNGKYT